MFLLHHSCCIYGLLLFISVLQVRSRRSTVKHFWASCQAQWRTFRRFHSPWQVIYWVGTWGHENWGLNPQEILSKAPMLNLFCPSYTVKSDAYFAANWQQILPNSLSTTCLSEYETYLCWFSGKHTSKPRRSSSWKKNWVWIPDGDSRITSLVALFLVPIPYLAAYNLSWAES